MTLVTIPKTVMPRIWYGSGTIGLATGNGPSLPANGDKNAIIFSSSRSGDITKILWTTGTVIAGGDITVRVETIDTSGYPTGTLWGTNTSATVTVLSTDDGMTFETTLTAAATVNAGDIFAVVFSRNSAYTGGGLRTLPSNSGANTGCPYTCGFASSAWSIYSALNLSVGLYYDSFGYEDSLVNKKGNTVTSNTYNNTSTPDVYGNVMSLPYNCEIVGVQCWIDADGDYDIVLFDTDGATPLRTITIDADTPTITGAGASTYYFDTPYTYTANSELRLCAVPNGASNVSLGAIVYTSAVIAESDFPGMVIYKTSAKDPNDITDWTDDDTIVMTISFVLSKIDDGAGGGSGNSFIFGS